MAHMSAREGWTKLTNGTFPVEYGTHWFFLSSRDNMNSYEALDTRKWMANIYLGVPQNTS
jgi:hypothetical protein